MKNLPISQFRLLEVLLSKWTKIGTIALGFLIALLGGVALFDRAVSSTTRGDLAKARKQLLAAETELKRAKEHPEYASRNAYQAIRAFEREFGQIALYRGCTVTAFQVAGDPTPFSTAFGKTKPDPTWTQGSVRFELTGHSLDAIAALRQVADCGVPIEFDSLEIRRGKVGPDGSDLIATGSLRVIGEAPGGKTS